MQTTAPSIKSKRSARMRHVLTYLQIRRDRHAIGVALREVHTKAVNYVSTTLDQRYQNPHYAGEDILELYRAFADSFATYAMGLADKNILGKLEFLELEGYEIKELKKFCEDILSYQRTVVRTKSWLRFPTDHDTHKYLNRVTPATVSLLIQGKEYKICDLLKESNRKIARVARSMVQKKINQTVGTIANLQKKDFIIKKALNS